MNKILKIFVSGDEQEKIPSGKIIERYDGFVLIEASAAEAAELQRNYLCEDITPLYQIQTRARTINTNRARIDKTGAVRKHAAYKSETRLASGLHHYLVQFIGPIKEKWLSGVRRAGGTPRAPFGDFTYVVAAEVDTIKRIASLPYVRWTGRYLPKDRVAKSVYRYAGRKEDDVHGQLPRTKIRPGVYTVEFFGSEELKAAAPEIKKLGFDVLAKDLRAGVMVISTEKDTKAQVSKQIDAVSNVHGVRGIFERPIKRPSNDVAARVMKTAAALGNAGLGLSGQGEIVAVCDTGLDSGDALTIHPDFKNRVLSITSYPISSSWNPYVKNPDANDGPADVDSGHGTHVAGSILGSGASSDGLAGTIGPLRGLAHKAKLVFQAVEQEHKWKNAADLKEYGRYVLSGIPDDLEKLFSAAYNQGARIHSNSWGGGDPGLYDDQCRQLDKFVWNNRDFCVVVAAGNDGTDKDKSGEIDLMSVTSPATAKNCITVGACENERPSFTDTYGENWEKDYPVAPIKDDKLADSADQVAAFSSRGPTTDGRVKPEIVAPGTYILSTRSRFIPSNNFGWGKFPASKLYMYDTGTSMATPLTAGALAVLREYLRKTQHINSPSAALLKATLIAGATRLPGTALKGALFDNHQGFGRVNIDAIVKPATSVKFVFLDEPASLKTGEIHSQKIQVKSSSAPLVVVLAYSDYPGKSLINNLNLIVRGPNGLVVAGNQPPNAGPTLDANNNVEVVRLQTPKAGSYSVEVVAANIPKGPQTFALVYSGALS